MRRGESLSRGCVDSTQHHPAPSRSRLSPGQPAGLGAPQGPRTVHGILLGSHLYKRKKLMTDARAAAVLWHKGRVSPFLLLKRGGNENRRHRASGFPLPRDTTACGHPGAAQNMSLGLAFPWARGLPFSGWLMDHFSAFHLK